MKKYIAPEMEIEKFECCDIMTLSGQDTQKISVEQPATLDSDAGIKFPGFEQ